MIPQASAPLRQIGWLVLLASAWSVVLAFSPVVFSPQASAGAGAVGLPAPAANWVLILGLSLAVLLLLAAIRILFLAKHYSQPAKPSTETAQRPQAATAAPPPKPPQQAQEGREALLLLSLFQEKGRLVDFVMEDITAYGPEQVAAAARVVHQGCGQIVKEVFSPLPVSEQKENAIMSLDPGYDSSAYRVVGSANGQGAISGTVTHKGWKAAAVKLPVQHRQPGASNDGIIVPAEIQA